MAEKFDETRSEECGLTVLTASQIIQATRREYLERKKSGLADRFSFYHFDEEPFNYYHEAYKRMGINPHDRLLDVGTFDGMGMWLIRLLNNHNGPMHGTDISIEGLTGPGKRLNTSAAYYHREPMYFTQGVGERLPYRTDAFNHAFVMFSAYHFGYRIRFVDDIRRVVKENGQIAIATSALWNKLGIRQFTRELGDYLDLVPPEPLSKGFASEAARRILPLLFDKVEEVPHKSRAVFPSEIRKQGEEYGATYEEVKNPPVKDGYLEYRRSLDDARERFMKKSELLKKPEDRQFYVPGDEEWEEAMSVIVEPKIREAFEKYGRWIDHIDRSIFICRNTWPEILKPKIP